ncbi:MAG TPA: hypothetical protein PLA68_12715, partial [Panacibacter sp.]|nr:hypothetical protein [Panacibacter sp.]
MRYLFLLLFMANTIQAQQKNLPANAYFDEPVPADIPVMFSDGIISDKFGNRDMAVSPLGDEIFYTLQSANGSINAIIHTSIINGKWTSPEVASFSGLYSDLEPAFSPDGSKLYFSSNRPLSGAGKRKDYDIWFVTKDHGEWVHPQNMGSPVNSVKNEFYASVAKTGNIYFTRAVDNRDEDIMICRFTNNLYQPAESLPDEINSAGDEFNAFVDPDEKFILFSAYGRNDDLGGGDLYISKLNEKSEWQQAINLGDKINTASIDYC